MNEQYTEPSQWEEGMKTRTINLAIWTGAWVVSMALATFGPEVIWGDNTALTLGAIVLNLLVGFGMIRANIRHLEGQDELQRKIQLNAMGFTLGVAVVVGLSYSLLDITDLVPFDAEISYLVILIGITYGLGVFLGVRKYR